MNNGWIKIHRKILENPIFSSEKGFRIWVWCLLKAGHQERDIYLGNEKIHLKAGEFIFGRGSASEQLGIKESTIRNWINTLKKDRYIDIKPTNKYSLIKVINWKQYQDNEQVDGQQSKNKVKTNQKQMDTNKKDKNVKNDKNTYIQILEYWNKGKVITHSKVSNSCKNEITKWLKEYSLDDLKKAIKSYAETLYDDDCYFSHKWTLEEFIKRGNGARVFLYKSPEDYKK